MWGGGRTRVNFGGRTQSLVGESNDKYLQFGSSFFGCCDASDVFDGQ